MELRVKEICKEKGLMFKELAQKVGITDIGLRQALKGNPTLSTLEKVAEALEVEVPELFRHSEDLRITCPHCGKVITLKTEK